MYIRIPKPEEYDRYAPVMIQLTKAHVEAMPDMFFLPEDAPKRHWFEQSFGDEDKLILFAEEGDEVLGVLLAEIQTAGEGPHTVMIRRKSLSIMDIVVDAKARKKGVGKALFERALAWGKERGAEDSRLEVYAFNTEAIAFYQTLGYEPLALEMRKVF